MKTDIIYNEDCLPGMNKLPDKSVDMILCDLPYGTTACKWDTIIPFEPLWKQYKRVIKDNGAIILTAQQPFTSFLIFSNLKLYRYNWVWEKTVCSNFLNLKRQPAKLHEDVCIFYKKQPTYNPIMEKGKPYLDKRIHNKSLGNLHKYGIGHNRVIFNNKGERFPKTIIKFNNPNNNREHPTQKPVALFEYLIKTYTNEGDIVLDNCIGSGTTAIACVHLKRHYVGFDTSEKYCNIAKARLEAEKTLWDREEKEEAK